MGRKAQVSKEQILQAGLQLIMREGHSVISIKSVAAELGTSTTPITWTFENIENYRRALREYAKSYMDSKLEAAGRNFQKINSIYVGLAIDAPNLIRYLRTEPGDFPYPGSIGFQAEDEQSKLAVKAYAAAMSVSEGQAAAFIRFVNTYTEGVVSLILSGTIQPTKAEANQMIREAGIAYTIFLKASERKPQGKQ